MGYESSFRDDCAIISIRFFKVGGFDKLFILLALASAHRLQILTLIKLSNIFKTPHGFKIKISDLIKTLCITSTFERYIQCEIKASCLNFI